MDLELIVGHQNKSLPESDELSKDLEEIRKRISRNEGESFNFQILPYDNLNFKVILRSDNNIEEDELIKGLEESGYSVTKN